MSVVSHYRVLPVERRKRNEDRYCQKRGKEDRFHKAARLGGFAEEKVPIKPGDPAGAARLGTPRTLARFSHHTFFRHDAEIRQSDPATALSTRRRSLDAIITKLLQVKPGTGKSLPWPDARGNYRGFKRISTLLNGSAWRFMSVHEGKVASDCSGHHGNSKKAQRNVSQKMVLCVILLRYWRLGKALRNV